MKDSLRFQGNVWKTRIVETVENLLVTEHRTIFSVPDFKGFEWLRKLSNSYLGYEL